MLKGEKIGVEYLLEQMNAPMLDYRVNPDEPVDFSEDSQAVQDNPDEPVDFGEDSHAVQDNPDEPVDFGEDSHAVQDESANCGYDIQVNIPDTSADFGEDDTFIQNEVNLQYHCIVGTLLFLIGYLLFLSRWV